MSGERPKYRDKRTERFARGERVKEFHGFASQANRRLTILEAAVTKESLMALASNRFHALGGNRAGQFSININEQWRICLEWPDGASEPSNIEITDYH